MNQYLEAILMRQVRERNIGSRRIIDIRGNFIVGSANQLGITGVAGTVSLPGPDRDFARIWLHMVMVGSAAGVNVRIRRLFGTPAVVALTIWESKNTDGLAAGSASGFPIIGLQPYMYNPAGAPYPLWPCAPVVQLPDEQVDIDIDTGVVTLQTFPAFYIDIPL